MAKYKKKVWHTQVKNQIEWIDETLMTLYMCACVYDS